MPVDQAKYAAYAEAFAAVGIAIGDVPMVQGQAWARDAAGILLDMAPDATAILSMSVMQAMAVLEEARRRGLVVPRDLSVVGFNDLPEATTADPPLTTVDGMNIEKGRVAARMVLEAGPPRHVVLPARLLIRASTAPPPR
jgi:LacI family transcriptional regulator